MASINDAEYQELVRVEQKAEEALKKVRSLYREIMGIKDTVPKQPDFVKVEEKTVSTYQGKSAEMTTKSCMKKFRSEKQKALPEKDELILPTVRREKKPPENYFFHFQNSCTAPDIPKSSHQNLVEDGNYVAHSAKTTVQKAENVADQHCSLKVTIPEPFQMTLREMLEKENRELVKQKLSEKWNKGLEDELGKKIHAHPVPSHVHLPLYQKIVKDNEQKKMQRKQQILQRLKSLSKPFNLTPKSNLKHHKSNSLPDLTSANQRFKARPAPQNILSASVSKHLKENEKRRKLRIAERSQELLKSSSLPFSKKRPLRRSSSLGNLSQGQMDVVIRLQSVDTKSKETPKLSGLEPKEICKEWKNKVTEMCQQEEIGKNVVNKVAIAEPKDFLISQALPFHDLPVKMTVAAMLREKQNRTTIPKAPRKLCTLNIGFLKPHPGDERTTMFEVKHLAPEISHWDMIFLDERKTAKELQLAEEEKRVENQKQVKKILGPKLKEVDPLSDSKKQVEEQLKMLREAHNLRQREYKKELEEMKSRVRKQRLLVERQSQIKKKSAKPPLDNITEITEYEDTMSKCSDDDDSKK